MNVKEALEQLGVRPTTLSPDQIQQIDSQGFLHFPGWFAGERLAAILRRQAVLLEEEGEQGGRETHQEAGSACLADLINKGTEFHAVLTEPALLAAVSHVLDGDLKLSSLNSRNVLPGHGAQGLHADWDSHDVPHDYQVCNSVWLLDDFTPENGATRLVPGSHLLRRLQPDDPGAPHPGEILLTGKAGDVFFFNAYCWHGGTVNRSDRIRRALHGYFCRRGLPPQLDQVQYLRPETRQQLSPAARVILGVE
ncbi:MAG: phytanoyl-CoA dioxygenase family protein [Chloroflexi bacterium]|nr:phytanoyl-CoA dioxygenase family protein [Chloroflexota bacterium]